MEDLAMRMSFDDARDAFYGSLETLTEYRDEAAKLLAQALTKPRFDAEAIERMRKSHLANLAYAARDPQRVASEQWMAHAFADHPYGRPTNGTPKSVADIGRADLAGFHGRVFAKDTLRVVVVGDIDATTLGKMLDAVFGDLPAKANLTAVSKAEAKASEKLKVIDMNVPQSVVRFGLPAMARSDKDFMPAFVLNAILGGSAFTSRLYQEVREKRGLAYGVDTQLVPMRYSSMFFGGVATKNEAVGQSLDVIRSELTRIATDGPTEKELTDTKSYLTGSFALRFDTNSNIANQLLWMLMEGLGYGYIETRNAQVEAVTIEDVRRAAKRLFDGQDLLVTVVGRPKGLGQGG
jgi:zinc protease